MNGHTPGPWDRGICHVTKEFLKGRFTEAVVAADETVVAITGEGDADAVLIAAAPELLEAAQWAANYLDTIIDPHALNVLNSLRAAISKATGA